MYRFQAVMHEINRGIKVDEKAGQTISDWSPKNLKRLIVGWNFFIAQYHITGGKFRKSAELKSIESYANKDAELFLTNHVDKIKPLINVLIEGRVCSNVEEIIFVTNDYDPYALTIDSAFNRLKGKASSIESRFPRLRGVYMVEVDRKILTEAVLSCDKPNTSVVEKFKELGIPTKALLITRNLEKDVWKRGSSVKTDVYAFDTKLVEHFAGLRKEFEEVEREKELQKSYMQRYKKYLDTEVLPSLYLVATLQDYQKVLNGVYTKAPIISKSEWAGLFKETNIKKALYRELTLKHKRTETNKGEDSDFESLLTRLRRLDFELVKEFLEEQDKHSLLDSLNYVEYIFFEDILKQSKDSQYKRASNKASLQESLTTLKEGLDFLFATLINITYLGFVMYLTRNTPAYAHDFYSRFEYKPRIILYTKNQIEYCNRMSPADKEGYAKQVFEKIGATNIPTEKFTVKLQNQNMLEMLRALKSL